ncbi:MAG: aminotransferase class I/II-fold pyridoxal phosphate-dependent enzyme, partial [Rhodospirillales bacterium]|nr:aminotransferase class I/II-fold pyridoxal phosphate-dependent enzyme [Rhodospirillales bacterium]
REVLIEEVKTLPGLRMIRPEGAFYAMPNVEGTGIPALQLQDRLLEELHVATVAGTSFGALGEGYIRLSYAAGVDEIRTAMKRIRQLAAAEGWGHHQ